MHAGKVRTENAEPEARCTRFLAFFRFPWVRRGRRGIFLRTCVHKITNKYQIQENGMGNNATLMANPKPNPIEDRTYSGLINTVNV